MRKIAVIGGGISGLSAAWYLQRQERYEVHLFERSSRLGGVIETLYDGPYLIEKGADNFATLIPDALELSRELGLDDSLLTPNENHRLARVVYRGKLYPIPAGFSLMQPTRLDAILATRVLSWPGKIRLLAEYFVPGRKSSEDESLQDFAIRRLGREAFERLVEPIVGGIFTARADRLSMQAAMPQFVAMEKQHGGLIRAFLKTQRKTSPSRSEGELGSEASRRASGARYDQFRAPRAGMQWWIDGIARRLDRVTFHRDCEIVRLEPRGSDWLLVDALGDEHVADGVLLTTPAPISAKLVDSFAREAAEDLQRIEYASSAVVVLVVRKDQLRSEDLCFGVVVPQIEKRKCVAISFSSEKYPGRTPEDEVLLRVFIGGAAQPELYSKSDEELIEMAKGEVRELLGLTSTPIAHRVVRWPNAMPQYAVGHVELVDRVRRSLMAFPRLQLAGNAYEGVGIPQCIRSAKWAVARLLG